MKSSFCIDLQRFMLIPTKFPLSREILSWLIMVVIVSVLFALMQMVKPYISKKKSTAQVVERIKEYYYSMYLQQGSLENFKAWLG